MQTFISKKNEKITHSYQGVTFSHPLHLTQSKNLTDSPMQMLSSWPTRETILNSQQPRLNWLILLSSNNNIHSLLQAKPPAPLQSNKIYAKIVQMNPRFVMPKIVEDSITKKINTSILIIQLLTCDLRFELSKQFLVKQNKTAYNRHFLRY